MENTPDGETAENLSWRGQANCKDKNSDLFFPVGNTGRAAEQIEAAVAICAVCVVKAECLQYALETKQDLGVWGGFAEDDRRLLRKRWLAERRRHAARSED